MEKQTNQPTTNKGVNSGSIIYVWRSDLFYIHIFEFIHLYSADIYIYSQGSEIYLDLMPARCGLSVCLVPPWVRSHLRSHPLATLATSSTCFFCWPSSTQHVSFIGHLQQIDKALPSSIKIKILDAFSVLNICYVKVYHIRGSIGILWNIVFKWQNCFQTVFSSFVDISLSPGRALRPTRETRGVVYDPPHHQPQQSQNWM